MPAFPAPIGVLEGSNPLGLGFRPRGQLRSAGDKVKSSTRNAVPIQQPQGSGEATERDEIRAAFKVYFTYSVVAPILLSITCVPN